VLGPVEQAAVDMKREARRRVPELIADERDVEALRDQQRGIGVAQVVEAEPGPGPRGGSSSRPNRKKTARSYSLKTRTKPSTTRS
jgi:hypothetical protein